MLQKIKSFLNIEQSSKKVILIILALFLIGLFARIAFNYTKPSADVIEYVRWGENTQKVGLTSAFEGGYFPFQYLLFGSSYSLAKNFDVSPENSIRTFNLIFEIGVLLLLVFILKKYLTTDKVLIYFWLNPFSLIIYQQGYVDPQFSFFILLAWAIILSAKENFYKYLIAGIPLGISLLMKPQAAPLFVGLGILAVFIFFKKPQGYSFKNSFKNSLKILSVFIAPAILYVAFSLYFGLTMNIHENHNTLPRVSQTIQNRTGLSERASDIATGSLFLTAQYVYVAQQRMPAINANMPNAWYFVADYLNKDNQPIYRVRDTTKVAGLISYRSIGFLIFFAILFWLIFRIAKSENNLVTKIVFVTCLIPLILPYLTTSAHENHFYLGFIGSIILGALLRDKFILKMGYLLGALNALNLLSLYVLPHYLNIPYGSGMRILITAATCVVFFVLLHRIVIKTYNTNITTSIK